MRPTVRAILTARMSAERSERRVVALLAVNVAVISLSREVVAPLAPDFTNALRIPASELGIIVGATQAAATASCLAGAFLFDLFDRRFLLGFSMAALVCGSLATCLARGLTSLAIARTAAAVFSSAGSITYGAILADTVALERRGRAMATVASASVIVVLTGIPVALELSRLFGWQAVFYVIALLSAGGTAATFFVLPPMRGHLEAAVKRETPVAPTLAWSAYLLALVFGIASGLILPNLPLYLTNNLAFPRAHLSGLFLATGVLGFLTLQASGRLVDRFGVVAYSFANGVLLCAALAAGFFSPALSAISLALLIEATLLARVVPFMTLISNVPAPSERGRFMAKQGAAQNIGGALCGFLAAQLLTTTSDQKLDGMPTLAAVAIAASVVLPLLTWQVERLRSRGAGPRPIEGTSG
jgi:predicted MFS family arabinose efflux permease